MSQFRRIVFLNILLLPFISFAQDSSLLNLLSDSLENHSSPDMVTGTFKATQILNTPSIESPPKNTLLFLIMHRFGKLSDGAYELFGLDNAEIRFALDYGITNRFSVGIGRSSYDKTYDANFKLRLLTQSPQKMPVSVSLFELLTYTTFPKKSLKPYLTASLRTAYTSQLLIARKFNGNLSLQLTPSILHFNMAPTARDKNTFFTLGLGGRLKITKRMSINGEYNYVPNNPIVSTSIYNSLSGGLDIETGGHVFQFVFTNSRGMTGPYYIAKTDGKWANGDIYFGFNISRSFNFNRD